ncbi:MAG TPA: hypothetical protein PK539_00935 [Candidatus Paceibacterota bacterium]|nr:hypothetical protein [Candidatus Paceibacterota bacterium]
MPAQRSWLVALAIALALLVVVVVGTVLLRYSSAYPHRTDAASTTTPVSSSTPVFRNGKNTNINSQRTPNTNIASSIRGTAHLIELPPYDFIFDNGTPQETSPGNGVYYHDLGPGVVELYASGAFVAEKTVDWAGGWQPEDNVAQVWCWKTSMTCDIDIAYVSTTTTYLQPGASTPPEPLSAHVSLGSFTIDSWSKTTVVAHGTGGEQSLPTCVADCGSDNYTLFIDLKNQTVRWTKEIGQMSACASTPTVTLLLIGYECTDPMCTGFTHWPTKEPLLGEYHHTSCSSGGALVPGPSPF